MTWGASFQCFWAHFFCHPLYVQAKPSQKVDSSKGGFLGLTFKMIMKMFCKMTMKISNCFCCCWLFFWKSRDKVHPRVPLSSRALRPYAATGPHGPSQARTAQSAALPVLAVGIVSPAILESWMATSSSGVCLNLLKLIASVFLFCQYTKCKAPCAICSVLLIACWPD